MQLALYRRCFSPLQSAEVSKHNVSLLSSCQSWPAAELIISGMTAKVLRPLEVNSKLMADWANIQTDTLGLITKKLSIPDYIRFRAVCTAWNRFCRDVCQHPRIDPWLMVPSNPVDGAKFFSLPERKYQKIHLPSTATLFDSIWAPIGSSHGWLIYYSSSHGMMQLVNPISGANIQLPFIGCREAFSKAALIDVNERSLTVAVIYVNRKGYAVTRTGRSGWSIVDSKHRLVDIFKHRGQLYTIDMYGTVEVWAEPPRAWPDEEISQMPHHHLPHHLVHHNHQPHFNCLVETPAGDLMRIKKRQSQNNFTVWILDKVTFTWSTLDKLGDIAVFVSHFNSVCFPVRGHPNLKANCIYFIDSYNNLCAFNLEDNTKELVETLGNSHRQQERYRRQQETYLWLIPSLK